MSGILTLLNREMKGYLQSPIAAIVVIAFLLLSGVFFITPFFLVQILDMRAFFSLMPFILAVVMPAISMRIWAEDRQLNTLELLLSLPIRPAALVLGKYSAALVFYALVLASTWTVPLMLALLGKPDYGPIASGYLGTLFLGALFLAVGQFISGLCRDQIVAFILGLFACLGLYLVGDDFIATSVDGWWRGWGSFLQQYLGISRHMAGFEKGVVDGRDVAFFLLLSAAFLTLNGIWMEGRLRPKARTAFAAACVLCLGIAMAAQGLLRYLPLGRFDWTASKLYTVSETTRELLTGLDVPVSVKLYLSPSEKMPTVMRTMERDLRDSLEELRLASGGKLKYEVLHTEASAALEGAGPPDEGELSLEQKLGGKGIRPFQVQSIEADEMGVKLVYAAASISYKDRPDEVIPQLMPNILDRFEYLILSKIYRLTLEETPRVAVVAPYEEGGMDPELAAFLRQSGMPVERPGREDPYRYLPGILQYEGYEVRRIELTESDPLPEGTRALVVVEPEQLNERQRYEVSRFLVEGGAVFIAAQRYRYGYVRRRQGIVPDPSGGSLSIDPLLESWGIRISRKILMDENSRVISVSSGARLGPFALSVPIESPVHIEVGQGQMNTELGMVSQLPPIFYVWGSPLEIDKERLEAQGVEATPLFYSSDRSWKILRESFDNFSLEQAPSPAEGRFPLGVLARGTFADPFEGRPVPDWPIERPEEGSLESQEEEKPGPEISSLAPAPGQLILIGCDEMFKEKSVESGGQLILFLNAVDTLVSGGKLVTIRNKQQALRTFRAPPPAQKAWYRFMVLGLMPFLVAGMSIAYAVWRRRLREAYSAL